MTQRTKAQLDALFPDNTTGDISPADLRDFVDTMLCTNGSMYVSASAATTIATPGTFVKAAGATTLVNGDRVSMPTDNRLRYDGVAPVHVYLVANLSVTCASNNQNIRFAIYKNGVQVDHSVMEHYLTTGADVKIMAIHADMDLATNDYVELWTTNNTSTGAVTVVRGYIFFMGMMCD